MSNYKYNLEEVSHLAKGQWLRIFNILNENQLSVAIAKLGKHVPCPVNGGKDGFRLFKDAAITGGGLSNKEGAFPNGFLLLQWLNNWDFPTCLERVAEALGVKPNPPARIISTGEIQYDHRQFQAYGEFVKSGFAPYKFNKKNSSSFYVVLRHKGKDRTIWGVDLEEVIKDVLEGDNIVLKRVGKQPVQITQGNRVINSHRNIWELVNRSATNRTPLEPRQQPQPQAVVENKGFISDEQVPDYVIKAEQAAKVADETKNSKRNKDKIAKVWLESVNFSSYENSPILSYLNKRGVSSKLLFNMQNTLKIHPNLSFWEFSHKDNKYKMEGIYPTMIAAVRNVHGEVVSLHRTYLTKDGVKAPGMNKKIMSPSKSMSGAAIRLGGIPEDGVIGVAEGIETALSVTKATKLTTWSAISAWGIESFEVPDGVKAVIIWADKDRPDDKGNEAGINAAIKLYDRLIEEGIACTIALPKKSLEKGIKSIDWNDVLVNEGPQAFPNLEPVKKGLLKQAELMKNK